jgi:hypothetical protein
MLPQLGFDPDTVQPMATYEHDFGTHLAKDLLNDGDKYVPSMLTVRPYLATMP